MTYGNLYSFTVEMEKLQEKRCIPQCKAKIIVAGDLIDFDCKHRKTVKIFTTL